MPGTFSARMSELQESVGTGELRGRVTFDQVYAVNQHEMGWLNFMGRFGPKAITEYHGGGGAKFLESPLMSGASSSMEHLAASVLEPGGPKEGMIDNVERLADEASAAAPIEFGDLRESAHPQVFDDGDVVYDRPPIVGRLSTDQLRAKERKAAKGDYVRDYLDEEHPLYGTLHEIHGGSHSMGDKPDPL